jgi:dimeric dUTPase (all-alpha-NTP-PPase superfamily)
MTFYVYKNIKKNVKPIKGKNINKMILNLYKNISNFQDNLNEINLDKSFSIFLGIGNILKFD